MNLEQARKTLTLLQRRSQSTGHLLAHLRRSDPERRISPDLERIITEVGLFPTDRDALYLVASALAHLYSNNRLQHLKFDYKDGDTFTTRSLGKTLQQAETTQQHHEVGPFEKRLVRLLRLKGPQFHHQLKRLIVHVGKEQPIDWTTLLRDLTHWDDLDNKTRRQWIQDFYKAPTVPNETSPESQENPDGPEDPEMEDTL